MEILTIHPPELLAYFAETLLVFSAVLTIGRCLNGILFESWGRLSCLNGPLRFGLDGASGWTAIISVLLVLAAFNVLWVWVASLLISCLFLISAGLILRKWRFTFEFSFRPYLHHGPLFLIGAAMLLGALKPPGAWDDTMYHLPYASPFWSTMG